MYRAPPAPPPPPYDPSAVPAVPLVDIVPTTEILHYKGVSGGIKKVSREITTASSETKKRATKSRFEAMRIFYNKHYKQKYPRFVSFLVDKGIWLKEHI